MMVEILSKFGPHLLSVFIIRSGSWPAMAYTKCSEYTSDTPTPRSLNLVSAIKV